MKKFLPYQKIALHFFSILCMMLLFSTFTWGQATIFDETFGTTASSPYTGGTSTTPSNVAYTVTSNNGVVSTGVASGNGFLNLASAGTSATLTRPNLTAPFSSLLLGSFSTTLANNTLPVEWTVNMKANRIMSSSSGSSYSDNSYYLVVVLCSTSANLISTPTGTNGYALILQRKFGGVTNALRLVRFTNGLISGSGGVPVGTSATTLLAETPLLTPTAPSTSAPNNLSVKVVYTPAGDSSTGTWELFYREDSGATFVDPTTGSLTSAGTSTDNTYTTTAMTHFGFLGSVSTSTAVSTQFQIDNFKIKGGAATVPTITSTKSTLTGFAYNQGSTSSTAQSFTIAGTNLNSNLVVTPSINYEISDDGGTTYNSSTRTYIPSSGTVTDKIIYTRLKLGLTANAYNETVTVASSGANVLTGGGVACSGIITGVYYYNGTGPLATETSWGSNTNGSGTQPTFTGNYQQFNIRNTTAVITDATWTVSGTNSKIILGDSTQPAITLTVASGFPIAGTIDIPAAASSGSNSIVLQDAAQPTFGTLDVSSEVHYNAVIVTPTFTTSTIFGKVIIDNPTGQVTWVGNPIIQTNGSLNVVSGSTLFMSGSGSYWTTINPGASVVINGTLRIQKVNGFVNSSVTPSSNYGSIQFTGTENLTLGADSIIEYNKSTNATTYNITARTYPNLTISGLDNNKAFLGATTVTGRLTLNQTGNSTLTGAANITLGNSATIVRTSGNLDAAPTFGSKVNVTYNGATAIFSSYEIPNATTLSTVLNDLTISTTAPAGITLASATNLNNKLTVTSGVLTTAGLLTLKSAECCTAFVGVLAADAVSGDVTVERYIPAKRAWRALTAPVIGTNNKSIFYNWQNNGTSGTSSSTGVDIWGPNGTGNAGDGLSVGPNSSMLTYSSSLNNWSGVTNTTTAELFSPTVNNPFMIFVTGPYGTGNITNGLATATTLRAKGSLIIGQQTYTTIANKYTFIGNPYASPLSLSSMITSNNVSFEGNIWIWDANTTVANPVGIYNLYNSGAYTNVTTLETVAPTTEIQSGQAFFVRSITGDPFIIQESNKGITNSAASIVFRDAAPAQLLRVGLYKQINTEWSGRDGAMTVILADANANQTPNKMANGTENVAFTKNSGLFASNHQLPLVASDVLNVKVWNTTAGANYKLKINTERFATTSLNATLEDLFTNSRTPLTLNGSAVEYPFAVTTEAASTGNRFRIVFENSALGINNPKATGISILPNPITGDTFQVNFGTLGMGTYSYSICNTLGQEVEKGSLNNETQNTNSVVKFKNNTATGLYIMKVTGIDNTVFTIKIIKK